MQPDARGPQSVPPQRHNPITGLAARAKKRRLSWITRELRISAFIVIVGAALIVASLAVWLWSSGPLGESSQINSSEYQAVFLTNGQVYFGKINALNHDYLTLSSVFYLQSNSSTSSTSNPQSSTKNNNLTLVKLGVSELHAPEDKMVINQSQVSFWENMKDSSKVVSAIKQYIANPSAANSSSTVQSTTGQ